MTPETSKYKIQENNPNSKSPISKITRSEKAKEQMKPKTDRSRAPNSANSEITKYDNGKEQMKQKSDKTQANGQNSEMTKTEKVEEQKNPKSGKNQQKVPTRNSTTSEDTKSDNGNEGKTKSNMEESGEAKDKGQPKSVKTQDNAPTPDASHFNNTGSEKPQDIRKTKSNKPQDDESTLSISRSKSRETDNMSNTKNTKSSNIDESGQAPIVPNVNLTKLLSIRKGQGRKAKWQMIDYNRLPKQDPSTLKCPRLNVYRQQPFVCVHDFETDQHISKIIATGRLWEKQTLRMIDWELSKDPNLGFIDIGAHVGQYSLFAAAMGHKVVAVEALKLNAELLATSAMMNGVQKNVTVYNNIMFTDHENLHIATSPGDVSRTCIYHDELDPKFVIQPETVPSVTLDDLPRVVPFKRAVLKIDIEGLEVYVLRHCKDLLLDINIPFILMEWWYSDRRYLLNSALRKPELVPRLFEFFSLNGYRAIDVKRNTLNIDHWEFWPQQVIWIKLW